MKSLKDQLLKAGLVDQERVKQLEHQNRLKKKKKKKKGKKEREIQEREKALEWEAKQQELKNKQRELAWQRKSDEQKKEVINRVNNIIQSARLPMAVKGPRKFYFVTPSKHISEIYVSEETSRKLESGELAIATPPLSSVEDFCLIPAASASKVMEQYPESILFFNKK